MCDFIGTRGEREWLAVVRRIASALERIADHLKEAEDDDSPDAEEP